MKKVDIKVNKRIADVVEALELNGYTVKRVVNGVFIKCDEVYLRYHHSHERFEFFSYRSNPILIKVKNHGKGDWSEFYKLIEKDKGLFKQLDKHMIRRKATYKGVDTSALKNGDEIYIYGDKFLKEIEQPDEMKVAIPLDLPKPEVISNYGYVNKQGVWVDESGNKQETTMSEWKFPCYGKDKLTGEIVLFQTKDEGIIVFPEYEGQLGWKLIGFKLSHYIQINRKEIQL